MNTQPFYIFRNEAVDEPASAELLIFDVIGDWEDMGEVSAKMFARDLSRLPSSIKRLDIHINSPGGSLTEAQAIYSRLADHRSDKHVFIDGLAASAASIIAMVGHRVYIRANANMMIHAPSGIAIGNADDMRKMINALDSLTESMINTYARKTKLERDEIRALLQAETWFSPQEAVDKGFADEVRGVVKAAALVDEKKAVFNGHVFDLSRFRNVPSFNASTTNPKTMSEPAAAPAPSQPTAAGGPDPGTQPPQPKPGTGNPPGPTDPPRPQDQPPPRPPPEPPPRNQFDDGVQAERKRVSELQALDRPATHEIITAAIKDGKHVSDIFAQVVDAMDKAGKQQARRTDASVLNEVPPSGGQDDDNELGTRLTKAVSAQLKNRGRRPLAHGRN